MKVPEGIELNDKERFSKTTLHKEISVYVDNLNLWIHVPKQLKSRERFRMKDLGNKNEILFGFYFLST